MSSSYILAYFAIIYYIALYTFHMIYLILGYRATLSWNNMGYPEEAHRLSRSDMVPPLTLVAELDSAETDIVQWVDHFLAQRFPEIEVILTFNVENDKNAERLIETYYLRRVDRVYRMVLDTPHPQEIFLSDDRRLTLVRTEVTTRGASLNLAINMARYPLIAVAGKGLHLEEDALLCMVRPFMEEEVLAPAVMGLELPLEMEKENLLPTRRITRYSLMESLRIQLGYQLGTSSLLEGPAVVYSSVMIFRKKDLFRAGGFNPKLPFKGAEMDMILKLHRLMRKEGNDYRMLFLPKVVARRPFARTWSAYFREVREKGKSVSAALWSERRMLFRYRYGSLGILQLPIYWLFVYLAPIIGFFAYATSIILFVVGKISWQIFLVFLASSMGYPALVGVGALAVARRELKVLQGQGAVLYGYAFATQFWFRQMTSIIYLFSSRADRGNNK